MRPLWLYLRSRSSRQALLRILALAALTWLLLWLGEESVFVPLLQTMMPVAVASVIGLSADSPFAELEETTSRSRVRGSRTWEGASVAAVALRLAILSFPTGKLAGSCAILRLYRSDLVAWRLFGAPYLVLLTMPARLLLWRILGLPLYEPGEQEALWRPWRYWGGYGLRYRCAIARAGPHGWRAYALNRRRRQSTGETPNVTKPGSSSLDAPV